MKSPYELRQEYVASLQRGPDGKFRPPEEIIGYVRQFLIDVMDLVEQTPEETIIKDALKAFK